MLNGGVSRKRKIDVQRLRQSGSDSNLLIVFYVQIMPDD
ncbi:DNA-binding protein, partial [Escherichia coli]